MTSKDSIPLVDAQDSSYEDERLANIKNNAALMASLGLDSVRLKTPAPVTPRVTGETRKKKRPASVTRPVATRKSLRVAGQDVSHKASRDADSPPRRVDPLPRQIAPVIPPAPSGPLSPAPRPTRGEDGTLIFEGRWKGVFTPNVSPPEMFGGGAFAGAFYADTISRVLGHTLSAEQDIASLPFTVQDPDQLLCNASPDGEVNRFKTRAGQSLAEWEKSGWIWAGDPRGWAQWYTRFWDGRRCEDDERQVGRWLRVAGPTGRFKRALIKKIYQAGGVAAVKDENVGRVLRQTLWQWGYQLTEDEYMLAT